MMSAPPRRAHSFKKGKKKEKKKKMSAPRAAPPLTSERVRFCSTERFRGKSQIFLDRRGCPWWTGRSLKNEGQCSCVTTAEAEDLQLQSQTPAVPSATLITIVLKNNNNLECFANLPSNCFRNCFAAIFH